MKRSPRRGLATILVAAVLSHSTLSMAANDLRLPDGTRVSVRLAQALSSSTAQTGDVVTFEVVDDVLVNGSVVIKAGTPARGTIIEGVKKRRMGRAGRLSYSLNETRSINGQAVKLRAQQDTKGDSNVTATAVTTTAVALFVPVAAPFFLLRKGKDIAVEVGRRVDGFVDGEHDITLATEVPETRQPADAKESAKTVTETPRSGSTTRMTNADVLALVGAGFGEDLIIARIQDGGERAFDLSTQALISLKKSGVSERVIAMMLQAQKD